MLLHPWFRVRNLCLYDKGVICDRVDLDIVSKGAIALACFRGKLSDRTVTLHLQVFPSCIWAGVPHYKNRRRVRKRYRTIF